MNDNMTELETLADETSRHVSNLPAHTKTIILDALTTAFALGRAAARTPAQIEAWEQNRRRIGGKPGRKDKQPRHRRTRAELEAEKQGEMK